MTVDNLAAEATDGWKATTGSGWLDFDGETVWEPGKFGVEDDARYVRFERTEGDLRVVVAFTVRSLRPDASQWDRDRAFRGATVEGNTTFNGRCFTRRGIDVSSCRLADAPEFGHEYGDLQALLDGEWTRCVAAHERSKSMVDVPGVPGGWRVTPERRVEMAAALRQGKPVRLTPHGMGTGYTISTRRARFGGGALPRATAEFFGVAGPLYYEPFDHD